MDLYKVILVDDEEEVREAIRKRINWEEIGYTVVAEADNGEDALLKAEQYNPDVVLTDIQMPFMDGLTFCRKLKEIMPDVRIIIFSGYDEFEYAQEAIRQNVFDYLLKPVSEEKLRSILAKISNKLKEKYELLSDDTLSGKSTKEIVKETENYLREHFREDTDLRAIADKFGFSSSYLSKIFTRSKGESPIKYLTKIRMKEAKRLLSTTDESIARVGELSGYPDQFYFSRTFRKEVGENPTQYRKDHRG